MRLSFGLSLAVLATAALTACGGGGGSAGGSETPSNVNVQAAWANLMGQSHSWALSGTATVTGYDPMNASATLMFTPQANAPFPVTDATAKVMRNDISVTIQGPGGTATNSDMALWYLSPDDGHYLGSVSGSGSCVVTAAYEALPTTARVGSGGLISRWTEYESCGAGAAQVSTGTTTWVLESVDNQMYFCVMSNTYLSGASAAEKDCFAVGADGSVGSAARVTVSSADSSGSLTVELTAP